VLFTHNTSGKKYGEGKEDSLIISTGCTLNSGLGKNISMEFQSAAFVQYEIPSLFEEYQPIQRQKYRGGCRHVGASCQLAPMSLSGERRYLPKYRQRYIHSLIISTCDQCCICTPHHSNPCLIFTGVDRFVDFSAD
jgi:hypothetical protein